MRESGFLVPRDIPLEETVRKQEIGPLCAGILSTIVPIKSPLSNEAKSERAQCRKCQLGDAEVMDAGDEVCVESFVAG